MRKQSRPFCCNQCLFYVYKILFKTYVLSDRSSIPWVHYTLNPSGSAGGMIPRGVAPTGPNEEWSGGCSEKLFDVMGLMVYAWVDKFSRYVLGMWVTGEMTPELPTACYVLAMKEHGGIPLRLTTDMSDESLLVANLHRTLRYVPFTLRLCRSLLKRTKLLCDYQTIIFST